MEVCSPPESFRGRPLFLLGGAPGTGLGAERLGGKGMAGGGGGLEGRSDREEVEAGVGGWDEAGGGGVEVRAMGEEAEGAVDMTGGVATAEG